MPGDAALQGNASPDLVRFADAVLSEGKSLLLVRPDSDALHNISQSLQSLWLAHAPQLKVEHFSGRLSAGLLGLINASLAHQALPEVMQGNPHQPPQHLCLVHDAECLSLDELLLLQRVIEHFPGWQIRLVLLFKIALDTSEKFNALLQQPGKGLVIWQLHAPSPKTASATAHQPHRLWWLGLLSLTMLGSAWVWLQWQKNQTTNPTLLVDEAPAPNNPLTAQSQSALPPIAAKKALDSAAQDSASVVEESVSPMPTASSDVAAQTGGSLPPVPDVAVRGYRWLSGLPGDFFVIAHGNHDRLSLALGQIEARSELSTARVIMLNPTSAQTSRFLVVTGPFRSLERAQNFKIRQKLPTSSDIQEVRAVLDLSRAGPKAKP